jgi:hypothetical protein
MNARHRWLAAALVATVIAALWPQPEDDAIVPARPAPPAAHPAPAAPASTPAVPAPAQRERLIAMQGNLFPQQTWQPPPPPPKPHTPPPPPPPQAPPLPFKYLGHWEEGGRKTLLLVQGEQPIPVQPGQTLAGGWRVDTISEHAVVFTYVPLDLQTTLGITP